MRTHRQEMQKSVEACIVLCQTYEAEVIAKEKKQILTTESRLYIERKMADLVKSLEGSRYKDVKSQLLNLVAIVESLSKEV